LKLLKKTDLLIANITQEWLSFVPSFNTFHKYTGNINAIIT